MDRCLCHPGDWSSAWFPALWQKVEHFETGPDYRIPYELSKDYWLYARRLRRQIDAPAKVILLGDSVIWGEYVLPDGTLSHFLNQEAGTAGRFVNGGVNGLFPLAQEGLVEALRACDYVIKKSSCECNVLWMTSPKADLSTDKEEQFNHSRLVPQFFPRIPCYKADANERLSAVVAEPCEFIAWVGHLANAYFGQKSILSWTLEDDGGDPPRYPNAYKNPLAQITFDSSRPLRLMIRNADLRARDTGHGRQRGRGRRDSIGLAWTRHCSGGPFNAVVAHIARARQRCAGPARVRSMST